MTRVLVTGGAGYIGTHTVLEMLEAGYDVTVLDSLANASLEALERVKTLTGKTVDFQKLDVLDVPGLTKLFAEKTFDAVIHFAGLKAVGESVAKPLMYYENNISGTINLLKVMGDAGCKNIVFSSSATVYGDPASVPVKEDFATSATNPYGRTKLFIEGILRDVHVRLAPGGPYSMLYIHRTPVPGAPVQPRRARSQARIWCSSTLFRSAPAAF